MFTRICRLAAALCRGIMLKLWGRDGVYYINGPDSLPPPLTPEEEERVFALLEKDPAAARDELIVHNLRLVVYSPRASALRILYLSERLG